MCEALAGDCLSMPIEIIGCPDVYPHADSYENLVDQSSLSANKIADRISKIVK